MTERYDKLRDMVEVRLGELFTAPGLEEAMRYSLLAGGKRIRPVLTLAFCILAGGDPEKALDLACALELVHTYSLIHDDLPIMDNDDLRRGRPTCHRVFGECSAALAGDALQAAAFSMAARAGLGFEDKTAALEAVRVLADMAGERGMCLGQYLDMRPGERTAEELTYINDKKTGCLLEAACLMGVLAAEGQGRRVPGLRDAAVTYAKHVGRAFQIKDDILDATSTEAELGKPVGSDKENCKETFAALWGIEKCEAAVRDCTDRAVEALSGFEGSEMLIGLARELAERRK